MSVQVTLPLAESRCEHGFIPGLCSYWECRNSDPIFKAARHLEVVASPKVETPTDFVRRCLLLADVYKLRAWSNVRRLLRGKGRWNGSR